MEAAVQDTTDIFKKHMKDVFGLCYYYLHNKQDSHDAVMEVFEVYIKYSNRSELRNHRAWLLETGRRISLTALRKRKKDLDFAFSMEKTNGNFVESDSDGHLLEERRLELMLEGLNDLNMTQRDVIDLFYLKRLSYKQVAEKLNLPEKAVKSHVQNGKRNLKIFINSRLNNE